MSNLFCTFFQDFYENLKINILGRGVVGGVRGGIAPRIMCYAILGFSVVGNPSFDQ